MRAIVLDDYRGDVGAAIRGLKLTERPIPTLQRGQVLVRIAAAPCNPSDLLLLQGKYGTLKKLPTVPGWEGAGTVIAGGGGWLANLIHGKRVACAIRDDRDGTWAEYVVADANTCVPLKRNVTFEQGASLIINPLTAIGLLDTARRDGHRAAVHTAAGSQVGRMLLALAAEADYPLIHVVRRQAQVELLKSRGAGHVLNSSCDEFAEQLISLCNRLRATAVFEAVAGPMTGAVLNAMPPRSTAYLYGALSEEACGNIDPVQLIFHEKCLRGFYLGHWLRRRGPIGARRAAGRVQKMILDGRLQTAVQRRLNFDEVVDGLLQYVQNMTDGKVLITPFVNNS
jgi:NADPH:quinone reductase-like Zn-dependent oxidoreductase